MRIILVGGGTSGHINPALNIAEYIKSVDKNAEFLYVGSKSGMEVELSKSASLEFEGITVSGFSRKCNFESVRKNLKSIKNIIISSFESKKILRKFNPDICIGTGGYVMGTFLYSAHLLGIPFVIQEQNSIPGLTTKILARFARSIFLGNEDAKKYLKNRNCIVTGNPIKSNFHSISKEDAKKNLGINNNLPVILSFGGSLGSPVINNIILEIMKTKKYNHIHGYGKNNKKFKYNFDDYPLVREYIDNMPECMAACDLIICRSGAMTLSELATLGKPAILIPSPNVTNNHQYHNAVSYSKKHTASVIHEKDLTSQKLISEIENLLSCKNIINPTINNACEQIWNNIRVVH